MRRSLAAVLLVALAACGGEEQSQLKVVNQNLYLGGPIFAVAGAPDPQAAAVATFQVWSMVQFTNFPARAQVIASNIVAQSPDVVGLQEVTTWRTGPAAVCAGADPSAPTASVLEYDFLTLLLTALQAKGLEYEVAQRTQSFDAEFCAVDPAQATPPFDVRYTDSDVILVRKGLATRNAGGGLYGFYVPVPIAGTSFVINDTRAWNVVEVEKDGQWYRVFETHLEVQEYWPFTPQYAVQLAQAGELVGRQVVPRRIANPIPTVVLGDFNSQAEAPPGDPLRTTYDYLTGAITFPAIAFPNWDQLALLVGTTSPLDDAWTATNGSAAGLTWGDDVDLTTRNLSQRLDLVLTWDATPVSMVTFGTTDQTSTNPPLYSSDHLGVAATIQP
jgi:endonuclease/exonuclease/phosphatase family metal-dependent hydrolase